MSTSKTAICLLTRDYDVDWFDFFQTFECKYNEFDIYMVIDKEPENANMVEITVEKYTMKNNDEKKINIVRVSDRVCLKTKYFKSSSWSNLKEIVAWDKALYFFNREMMGMIYENIWFMEDDVFFYDENTIINVNEKYPKSDLLCAFHDINEHGSVYKWNDPKFWDHWFNVINRITPPWSHSLISVCRMSRRLMNKIDEYVLEKPHLMFIEALFNTLALHNNYIVDNPEEMAKTITYDKKWTTDELNNINNFYHPLKKIEEHKTYRINMCPMDIENIQQK